jgi:Tfp pilus assembly protein PilF
LKNNYKKNMHWLKMLNPKVADQLGKARAPKWYNEIYLDNQNNFSVTKGAKVNVVYNKDAIKNYKEIVKQMSFNKENVTVIIGIGLGFLLNSMVKAKEKGHIIVVYEPIPFLIKRNLELYDFSEEIKNGSLLFACPGKDEFQQIVSMLESRKVIEGWEVLYEKYVMSCPEEYTDAITYSSEVINSLQCNTGTVMAAGGIIAKNDISNLPYVITHRGVEALRDLYKDKPAVLVSTGPSLQKNIHHLIENQDKVIIIAVAQAMRVLLAYGITPDFITTVDYGEVNIEHFKSLMHQQIPLVALNRSYKEILKRYKGPKFITISNHTSEEESICGLLKCKGSLDQGGSVAHLNFAFAKHLGCNPIAFTGQDLAFENDKSHIPLVDAGGRVKTDPDTGQIVWEIDDPRSTLQSDKDYAMGMTKNVPSYYDDGFIPTNVGLASFITAFEYMIKHTTNKDIFNCTEGGAKITGAKPMVLKDYLDKFAEKTLDKSKIEELKGDDPKADELIDKAIKLLRKERKDLINLKKHSIKAREASREMLVEKNKAKLDELIKTNAEYSDKAEKLARANQLVSLCIYKESREIQGRKYSCDKHKAKDLLKYKDNRIIRAERNILILEASIRACEELRPLYTEALNTLVKYRDSKDKKYLQSDEEDIISIDDAEDYFKVGNWAHPILDADYIADNYLNDIVVSPALDILYRARGMREAAINESKEKEKEEERWKKIRYWHCINRSKEVGRNKDFIKSLEYLKEAIDILEDNVDAQWGLASIYYYLGRYKEAKVEYEKLIKKYPENNRYQFEYGQVMLLIDRNKGMKVLQEVMKKTDEFDSFLIRVGQLYMQRSYYQEAIDTFNEYIKKYPLNAEAWLMKADCHKALFQKVETAFCLTRYSELTREKK